MILSRTLLSKQFNIINASLNIFNKISLIAFNIKVIIDICSQMNLYLPPLLFHKSKTEIGEK